MPDLKNLIVQLHSLSARWAVSRPKAFSDFRISAQILLVAIVFLVLCGGVQAQTDDELYYRKTHHGSYPGTGMDTSDHSGESGVATNVPGPLPPPTLLRAAGVDPNNLGKGDWIWTVSSCISSLGLSAGDVQGLINYEKNKGMQWITVKCGDGSNTNSWTQFNTDIITRAHAAGMKIFGWAYVYGNKFNNVQGEINAALSCLDKGADGFIIDAEIEYEGAGQDAAAAQYLKGIRARYPNVFLAHAPFPIISSHSAYPYITFGKYCDAVMPQAYWKDIGNSATGMVSRLDTEWKNWQNGLAAADKDAIKPIIPIGQGYTSVNGAVTNGEITAFISALQNDISPASVGGYKGVSFWSCQHHTSLVWNEIGAAAMGATNDPPTISVQPFNRSVDQGTNVMFIVSAYGANPLSYQWRFNGTNIVGKTADTNILANVQLTNAGLYSVIVSNTYGVVTSSPAKLVVNLPATNFFLVFSDDFETNSSVNWQLFQGSGNGVSDYTATWAFDYSASTYTFNANLTNGSATTNPIPSAPNSVGGTKHGLKLTVNKNDATAATAGVSLYPKGKSFSGDYLLRFDMWMNYNGSSGGGSGSTEYATFGINHAGTRINWGSGTATASDGIWFAVDGECGAGPTSADYRCYVGNAASNPTQLSFANGGLAANGAQSDMGSDQFYYNLFNPPVYETPGAPGKHWVQGEVSQIGSVITWRLNGTVIAQRTNTSAFTSGNVMIGYQDIFTSIANPAADAYIIFDNVRVYATGAPPVIAIQPQSTNVLQGGGVTFSVSASGSNPLGYQWQFNGTNINGATQTSYAVLNAQGTNEGNYSVIVSNFAGTAVSSNAVLMVNEPPVITTQPVDKTVNQGQAVLLRVVAGGDPTLYYQWMKGGTAIAGATSGNYIIANAQPSHADNYWAVITNAYGSVTSAVVTLTVNIPPTITAQPQSQSVVAGAGASFTVAADGTGPLGYQWLLNGVAISGATGSSYTRSGVQTNDAGNYSVVVTNVAGSVTSTNALLTVLPPAPVAQFQTISQLPDGRISLTLSGQAGSNYAIEDSTNLLDWLQVTNFTSDGGSYQFIDNGSTNNAEMFYRARLLP